MKISLSKKTLLQLSEMTKLRGGNYKGMQTDCSIIQKPMPLDTPCNQSLRDCPVQTPPPILGKCKGK